MNTFFDIHQNPIEIKPEEKISWRISAYAAILSEDKKILLVKAQYDKNIWLLPGGEINTDESIAEGIERECYEETGYRIKIDFTKPIYTGESNFYCCDEFRHSINLIYPAKLLSTEQNKEVINSLEPNEIEKVEWVSLSEISENNCHHIMYPAIKVLKNE